jgi:hypothetical protein
MMQFIHRVIGAAALDNSTYEEVELDRNATMQAMTVVVLSAVAAGIGMRGFGGSLRLVPLGAAVALLAWGAWAYLTYVIGTRLLPARETEADVNELLRTIGFAAAPGLFRVLAVIPAWAAPIFTVTTVWMLLTMIVAVRHALDYDSIGRAVLVAGLAFILVMTVVIVIGLWFSPALS